MSEKRRDNKGRVLHDNEFQRKDGRYEYRYYDAQGRRCSLYSWRLTATDKQPIGKRPCQPLRDLENLLAEKGPDHAKSPTLNDCWDQYLAGRVDLRLTTMHRYVEAYDLHVRPSFGTAPVQELRYTTIRDFYISLMRDKQLSVNRIQFIHDLIHPTLDMVKQDGLLIGNPSDGATKELRRMNPNKTSKRRALTEAEQKEFLDFIQRDRNAQFYRPLFICLLGTGCRIGEMLALTWDDIDWKNNVIHIRRSLTVVHGVRRITQPKSPSGVRDIPMLSQVQEALKEMQNPSVPRLTIDGVTNFIWINQNGSIPYHNQIDTKLRRISERHNRDYPDATPLPRFSAHQLRHTFCARICQNETDLKLIQEIMGHSNIQITMDVYNESNAERKQASFQRLEQSAAIF